MTALVWDAQGAHLYETGVDRGVLYKITDGVYDTGFAWNGLTTVTESPSGAEATAQYADNIKYLNLLSIEEFGGTIEAFTYPDEFSECDGSAVPEAGVYVGQQPRKAFGMSYRTRLGNEVDGTEHGYKLHMVWGMTAAPSEKAFASINDSPEAINFSWQFWTVPVPVTGLKPTSYMCIDSTKVGATPLATLETKLYGTVGIDPALPTPDEVIAIFAAAVTQVTPTAPTYDSGTDIVTIPSVTGVQYSVAGVGDVASGAYGPITANILVKARPTAGYKFPDLVDDDWLITFA